VTSPDVMQRDHMSDVNRLRMEELRDKFATAALQGMLSNPMRYADAITAARAALAKAGVA